MFHCPQLSPFINALSKEKKNLRKKEINLGERKGISVCTCTFMKIWKKKIRSYLGHVKLEMPIRYLREMLDKQLDTCIWRKEPYLEWV